MWSGACRGGAQAVVGARAESLEGWASRPHPTPGLQGPRKRSGNGTRLFSHARPQPLSAVPALLEQTVRQRLPSAPVLWPLGRADVALGSDKDASGVFCLQIRGSSSTPGQLRQPG